MLVGLGMDDYQSKAALIPRWYRYIRDVQYLEGQEQQQGYDEGLRRSPNPSNGLLWL
jgi:hypothetical protein